MTSDSLKQGQELLASIKELTQARDRFVEKTDAPLGYQDGYDFVVIDSPELRAVAIKWLDEKIAGLQAKFDAL